LENCLQLSLQLTVKNTVGDDENKIDAMPSELF
jgi:hypothetical protein